MARPRDDADDPPWFSPSTLLGALVPTLAIRRAQRDGSASLLATLRQVFTSFALALLLIGVVVLVLAGSEPRDPAQTSSSSLAAWVVGFGVLTLVAPRLFERPLDCSSEGSLLGTYRTRFFLRIAIADAAALMGFVFFFLSGHAWMYPLGAVFAAVGFVRAAPSRTNLEADRDALMTAGCAHDLATLLATTHVGREAGTTR